MENSTDNSGGLISAADMDSGDKLIDGAAAAIDAGDYHAALSGICKANEFMRRTFGKTPELTELERTIADIQGLLEK